MLAFSKGPALTCTPESTPVFHILVSDIFVHGKKWIFFLIPFFVLPPHIPTNYIPIPMDFLESCDVLMKSPNDQWEPIIKSPGILQAGC